MRFLVDECCDQVIVNSLQQSGFDVASIPFINRGKDDSDVIAAALQETRIVITEDKDFGQLIFAHGYKSLGVIFLRYPHDSRSQIINELIHFLSTYKDDLNEKFITVQPGRIRINPI